MTKDEALIIVNEQLGYIEGLMEALEQPVQEPVKSKGSKYLGLIDLESEFPFTEWERKELIKQSMECLLEDGELGKLGMLLHRYEETVRYFENKNPVKEFMKNKQLYTHPCVLTHTALPVELKPANIAKARDEIYYAWRKYWAWGIPSKDGEAVFNANGDGFQAGWLACEEWINKEKNT